jgi:hypothetical protein
MDVAYDAIVLKALTKVKIKKKMFFFKFKVSIDAKIDAYYEVSALMRVINFSQYCFCLQVCAVERVDRETCAPEAPSCVVCGRRGQSVQLQTRPKQQLRSCHFLLVQSMVR